MDSRLLICRLCMNKNELSSIFKIHDGLTVNFKANQCNLANIQENDGLPQHICRTCEFKVHYFYEYRLQCIKTNDTLVKFLKADDLICSTKIGKEKEKFEPLVEVKVIESIDNNFFNDGFASPVEDENIKTESTEYTKIKNGKKREYVHKKLKRKKIKTLQNNSHEKRTHLKNDYIKRYQCELCGKAFRWKSVLKKHMESHTGLKKFQCPLCSKSYTREEHRVNHLRTHTGEKPFICEICGRGFIKKQDLLRHGKMHSDVRNYPCVRCDKRFKHSGDLVTHMRIHTGYKAYKCRECKKAYATRGGLRKHILKLQCKQGDEQKSCDTDKSEKIVDDESVRT